MRVVVDAYNIKNKVKELLIESYGFEEDGAEDIAHDVERILEENEDD